MSDKIKVLMVDDEKQFRTTTEKILHRKGFDTIMAASGEEALSLLNKSGPFDLMVLDLKMPGMDGKQVLEILKKEQKYIEVIILTGHGTEKDRQACMAAGAHAFMNKPLDIDGLLAIMDRLEEPTP